MAPYRLARLLGDALGDKLSALAWDRDPREIKLQSRAHSVGAQSAMGRKPFCEAIYRPTLLHLADRVATRLRAKSRPGRTVTVRVRFLDLRSVTRSVTLPAAITGTAMLAEIADHLVRRVLAEYPKNTSITLLAISVSGMEDNAVAQLELPLGLADDRRRVDSKVSRARGMADLAIDKIRGRFGWDAIGYGEAALGLVRSVPDAFRELAERKS